MARSDSSNKWLKAHFKDMYVKKAQLEGYRSRAVYKLKEIDEKDHLLKPGMTVVDLGAAPGGWTQYVTQKLQGRGSVIALDILPMDTLTLPDVHFIQGDFCEEEVFNQLISLVPVEGVDLVLSDMAPNMSGMPAVDIPRSMYLVELAIDFAEKMLKPQGNLLVKIFHGSGFEEIVKQLRQKFKKVIIRKPDASRPGSRETYLLAKDFIPKIL